MLKESPIDSYHINFSLEFFWLDIPFKEMFTCSPCWVAKNGGTSELHNNYPLLIYQPPPPPPTPLPLRQKGSTVIKSYRLLVYLSHR